MSDSPASPWTRQHGLILGAILLLALAMRAFFLNFPHGKFFDEIYYVNAAHDYLEGRPDSNSVHPPMAKIQLAATMLLFDVSKLYGLHHLEDTIGWRLLPTLCGVGVVGLTAWLALAMTGRPRVSLLAAGLVAIDHLSVAESRITTLDTIQTFWITLGICCAAHRLWRSQDDSYLWFSALSLGVATACKWNGLFAASGVVLALWTVRPIEATAPVRPGRLKVLVLFALLIPTTYVLSYIPYARSVPEKNLQQVALAVRDQHTRMIKFRYDSKQFKHQYLSHFFQWPFVVRPVWFHYKSEAHSSCSGIVAFGMIPFWWFSAYLLLESVAAAWRKDWPDPGGQFLVLNYATQWLLWASSTTGGFFYYMVTVVPLMAVAVARQLDSWLDQPQSSRLAWGFLVVLGLLTLLYYPFMSGIRVPYTYFQALFFLPIWI
jgi:dolichyl-phosphate-mannose--protein O-mannosyl transferase